MSVLVDTGVFYAHHDRDAEHHESAKTALTTILEGSYGQPYTTDYVYDETVTLTRTRINFSSAQTVGERIRNTDAIKLLHVTKDVFHASVKTFRRYPDQTVSFTDATTVTTKNNHDIDYVLSFDTDFDGVTQRLDPTKI